MVSCYLRTWQVLTAFFALLSVALLVALIVISIRWNGKQTGQSQPTSVTKEREGTVFDAEPSPFDILNTTELSQVKEFMLKKTDLNLVPKANASLASNYIYLIDSPLPNKVDMLAYLDQNQRLPTRSARVIVIMGAKTPPVVREYLVSPIPNPTMYQLITDPLQPHDLDYSVRPDFHSLDSKYLDKDVIHVTEALYPILHETYGFWLHNCTDKCLHFNYAARNFDQGGRFTFVWFFRRSIDGYYLWPIYFVLVFHNNGNEYKKFALDSIYYENQKFSSTEQLLDKYKSGLLNKKKYRNFGNWTKTYGSPDREVPLTQSTKRPPQQMQPDGQRFTVRGRHVQYLDWSFTVRSRTVTGPHLLDIRHKNERIAYEIGTNDISVYYSGPTPFDIFTLFMDAGWSFGSRLSTLITGSDCPDFAVFFNHTYFNLGTNQPDTTPNAICVFEHNSGVPLRRHVSHNFYSKNEPFHYRFSMPDSVLIVRAIPTVWNYDYIIDFVFHQNGVIETRVSSTGYVQTFPYTPDSDNEKYGFTINKEFNVMANMHHHLFNFKFDLDIGGVQNRFATWDIEVENKPHPFQDGLRWYQDYMNEHMRSSEKEALTNYNFDKPRYFVVYSNKTHNSEGHKKGYRVHSGSFSKMLLPGGWQIENALSWARHQVAVTRHHDNEDTTATPYNHVEVNNPVRKFETFYADNEGIVDEDLVVWATVGLHHIPVMEDVAVTTTAGKQLSVVLAPLNYFDDDPSMYSNDAILIRP